MFKTCACGSGEERRAVYDARGIFCFYACDRCEPEKREPYRPEIFTDPNYETTEDIEAP